MGVTTNSVNVALCRYDSSLAGSKRTALFSLSKTADENPQCTVPYALAAGGSGFDTVINGTLASLIPAELVFYNSTTSAPVFRPNTSAPVIVTIVISGATFASAYMPGIDDNLLADILDK